MTSFSAASFLKCSVCSRSAIFNSAIAGSRSASLETTILEQRARIWSLSRLMGNAADCCRIEDATIGVFSVEPMGRVAPRVCARTIRFRVDLGPKSGLLRVPYRSHLVSRRKRNSRARLSMERILSAAGAGMSGMDIASSHERSIAVSVSLISLRI
jgi:hypothetical protein